MTCHVNPRQTVWCVFISSVLLYTDINNIYFSTYFTRWANDFALFDNSHSLLFRSFSYMYAKRLCDLSTCTTAWENAWISLVFACRSSTASFGDVSLCVGNASCDDKSQPNRQRETEEHSVDRKGKMTMRENKGLTKQRQANQMNR